MSQLPPELQVLLEGYRQILDEVDSGKLTIDSAYERLAALSATDGSGARWGVSPDHDPDAAVFLRTPPEGGTPVAAPPHMFTPGPAPSSPPDPGGASTVFDETATGWTDEVDQLLEPPPTPGGPGGFDDEWGTQMPWDGPNLGFPDDTHVGPPTDTGWDTPYTPPSTHTTDPAGPDDMGSPGPRDVTPKEGWGTRIVDGAAGVWDRLRAATASMSPSRKRTTVIAVACVVVLAVFLLTRGNGAGDDEAAATPFTYDCPDTSLPISGVSGDAAALLGCLDSLDDDPGPAIAGVAVERVESGEIVYRPERQVTRAEAIHTALRLYSFAGGPAAQSSTPIDTAGLPEDQAASVQAAANLGIVEGTAGDLTNTSNRGTQAVLLYRALTRAGVVRDARSAEMPTDTPEGTPELGLAVAALRTAGIIDGAVTDPFRFGDPLVVSDWTTWAGRSAHEIRDPGSMERRLAAATGPGTGTGTAADRRPTPRGDAPSEAVPGPERVGEVITAVTSGDPTITRSVVTDSGGDAVVAERTATWVGFAELGYTVAPQAAPAADGDGVVQVWQVGPADADPVLTYKVTWTRRDGDWVLAGWPAR